MDELALLALVRDDGSIDVQFPRDVPLEEVVASIIKAAALRGCDMARIFRVLTKLRVAERAVSTPLVIQ